MTIEYKGYEITPISNQFEDSGEWTVGVSITKHRGSDSSLKPFSASNTFLTKEEAVAHSIEFGKKIINGEQPGVSIHDL